MNSMVTKIVRVLAPTTRANQNLIASHSQYVDSTEMYVRNPVPTFDSSYM
jgi:hypothetical protein